MNEQKFKATIDSTLQNSKDIHQKLQHSKQDSYKQSDLVKILGAGPAKLLCH
jgi:uncharacterized Rmd1/YagE family protein